MKKILRSFSKLMLYFIKFTLRFIDALNPRLYMLIYCKILKLYGLKIKGNPRYISSKVKFDDFDQIEINDRVVISENVILLTHDYSLTTALISINELPKTDIAFIKPIVIKSNVFIGMNALILPGTVINENVIIGAGSVVRGNIETDSIIIGNPGKKVSFLSQKARLWRNTMSDNNLRVD